MKQLGGSDSDSGLCKC
jgi:CheY-like chemotaxis protein